ncbi:hypothetical protein SZN_29637 [Streptomyces zinciresistens K42]|uniref:Uncharacterized protein n=1 Tax=Streptomyces zinciresistens K42 TaxID=700597 RepID=G2GK84_9ACTN|nr:hypothetical protein SZN_29637 [Streptomyces zinciresistens K42]
MLIFMKGVSSLLRSGPPMPPFGSELSFSSCLFWIRCSRALC